MRYRSLLLALLLCLIAAPSYAVRLNSNGDVTAGVGGGRVSINDAAVGTGGSPDWFTNTEIVYNGTLGNDVWRLLRYDTGTRQTTELQPQGANFARAGGGVWARWAAGLGLSASTGFACKTCGLLEVGPDGVIYYTRSYTAGKGLVARYPDGREAQIIPETQTTALAVRGVQGGAIYTGYDNKARSWGLPTPVTAPGEAVFNISAAKVGAEWWIVYGTHTRLLAQPIGQPTGYVLVVGNAFGPDSVAHGAGLRVAYSTTQGEQPGQVRVVDVDLTKPRVPLAAAAPKPPAPTTEPAAADAIDPSTIIYLHAVVKDWPITSKVTKVALPAEGKAGITIEHTKAGKWQDSDGAEGNPWACGKIGGRWYCGTFEWLRPGQTHKPNVDRLNLGDHIKQKPLLQWDPKPGEQIGLFVSTLARDGRRNGNERSNIVLATWPGTAAPPEPEPEPECPPDLSAELAHAQADANRLLAERDEARRAQAEATAAHDNAVAAVARLEAEIKALQARRCEAKLFGVIPVPCRLTP